MASVPCATRSQNGFPGGDQTLAPVVEFHLRARKIRIAVPALTRQLDDNSGTSRTALPLDLAFGLTVHRAAGLTVDAIILHGDSLWPMGGLCYTALSRVRSIEHVQILGSIQDAHIFSRQDCVTFMKEEYARSCEADNAAPKRQAEGPISPPSKKPNAAPQPQPATAMPAPQPQPSPAAAPAPSRVPPVPAPSPSKKRKAEPPPSQQHQKPTASPAAARRHAVEENIEESRSATGKAPDSNLSGVRSMSAVNCELRCSLTGASLEARPLRCARMHAQAAYKEHPSDKTARPRARKRKAAAPPAQQNLVTIQMVDAVRSTVPHPLARWCALS